jgi:hypothetical protein
MMHAARFACPCAVTHTKVIADRNAGHGPHLRPIRGLTERDVRIHKGSMFTSAQTSLSARAQIPSHPAWGRLLRRDLLRNMNTNAMGSRTILNAIIYLSDHHETRAADGYQQDHAFLPCARGRRRPESCSSGFGTNPGRQLEHAGTSALGHVHDEDECHLSIAEFMAKQEPSVDSDDA